jgi:hypothetical protein
MSEAINVQVITQEIGERVSRVPELKAAFSHYRDKQLSTDETTESTRQ